MATTIPQNHARFTVDELARITNGQVLRPGDPVVGISTDSRAIGRGSAFLALVGERFDGHTFLEGAVEAGASALVVSDTERLPEGPAIVEVEDTKLALGRLGHAHRMRWASEAHPAGPRALVAVTGSAGKTTTRKAIAALLEVVAKGQVFASVGNLNNEVGVPMSLLGLEAHHRFGVVELGTSGRGEIAYLSDIAAPDAGVITLVAPAHTAGLGTVDDVASEKGALFEALGDGGIAIANADDERVLSQLHRTRAARILSYGFDPRATYRILDRSSLGLRGSRLRIERPERVPVGVRRGVVEVISPLLGDAGALAAAAALAVAETLSSRSLPGEPVSEALATLSASPDGRLSVVSLSDGTVVIDDSYNANPASMRSSIATASELAREGGRRLVLVLGEMRELGEVEGYEHDTVGALAAASSPASIIAVSGAASRIAERARERGIDAVFAQDVSAALPTVLASVHAHDLVLVKGSRGVALEQVVRALADRAGHKGGAP